VKPITLLIAGFGRFPGAPVNPTAALVARLAHLRRPVLGDARLVTHVFATRHAAVDRELPALIAREKPDAILLFGVATKAKAIRIELLARNRRSVLFPDAGGVRPTSAAIESGAPAWRATRAPVARLAAAARAAGVRPTLSHHAGGYLCNYAYWHALKSVARDNGPRLAVFVHVPLPLARRPRRPHNDKGDRRLSAADLTRAGEAILLALLAAARDAKRQLNPSPRSRGEGGERARSGARAG
jgi:pyroglutamyl-peptidase